VDRLRILVVEDDPIYASFLAETLRNAGHDVVIAKDGASGRALIGAEPDAVVLDLKLPDEDGYSIARTMRRELPATSVIILLTAQLHPAQDMAAAVGIDLVLTKPVEEAPVVEIVRFVHARRERTLKR
jgi:DNA-binding response OmpR family regulator